jgi:pimeloyl-ACP methyl ester carboxylesterase
VLPELGAHFTVYTMDRRGRGESGDAEPYRLEAEFDDVAAVVDSIGRDVSVLGHSYGALCSLEAARRTSGITKLLLYEPPLGGAAAPDEPWLVKAQQEIDRGERDAVLASFFTEVVGVPADQLSTLRELPVWQARLGTVPTIPREFRAAVAYQLDPTTVSEVNIPVLLLRGGDTDWSDVPTAQLEAALPHAHTTVMPGQQHVAMDTGKPQFLHAVFEFSAYRADQEPRTFVTGASPSTNRSDRRARSVDLAHGDLYRRSRWQAERGPGNRHPSNQGGSCRPCHATRTAQFMPGGGVT